MTKSHSLSRHLAISSICILWLAGACAPTISQQSPTLQPLLSTPSMTVPAKLPTAATPSATPTAISAYPPPTQGQATVQAYPPSTILPASSPTSMPPSATPTMVPTQTPWPLYPKSDSWLTRTLTDTYDGTTITAVIDYPRAWRVLEFSPTHIEFDFPSEDRTSLPMNYIVMAGMSYAEAFDNPLSWPPNEGGMVILWSRPFSLTDAYCLEYLWGPEPDGPGGASTLGVSCHSKKYAHTIRLSTGWISGHKATIDITSTLAANYNVFEHMMQSIRFPKP